MEKHTREYYCRPAELPSHHKFLETVGEGCFGKVVKCQDIRSGQTVAIKFPKSITISTINESSTLEKIKSLNLDKHNIVKYIECFPTSCGKAFVFESLDISLHEYMMRRNAPMLLSDIRTIIQQMATALKALKEIELIHTDIKLDNIMMVDHQQRPFEVKLIDFGLAMYKSRPRLGSTIQPQLIRAPEVILGCELSEAIDMWTLGCAMFKMICGYRLFSGADDHKIMIEIFDLLGQPADDFLKNGRNTKEYFNKNDQVWSFKFPCSLCKDDGGRKPTMFRFKSLDDLKVGKEKNETEERNQCIELLKAMLKFDARERITPCEVLTHPFITNEALASASTSKTSK